MKRLLPLVLLVCLCVGCGSSRACSVGSEIVLRAVPLRGEMVTHAGMELARQIIANRVGALGVSSPTVEIRGGNEIVIAGSPVPTSLARAASVTGNLQFFDFEKDLAPPTVKNGNPTPYPTLYSLLSAVKDQASKGTPEAYYLFGSRKTKTHRNVNGRMVTKTRTEKNVALAGPYPTKKLLLAGYRGHQPPGTSILAVPAHREVVSGTAEAFTPSTQPVKPSPDGSYWYLFKTPSEISGKDIRESAVTAAIDPNTGTPQVTIGFTRHGAKEFQAITKAEYDRGKLVAGLHGSAGQLMNPLYGQHSAIVLDNRLHATPYIDYTDAVLSLGIAGGSAVISNMGSMRAANNLALVLQSGSLPYRFELVSSKRCRR